MHPWWHAGGTRTRFGRLMEDPGAARPPETPPPTPALLVWLEPGYDYGRFGAWMLDWPGSFAWGRSREAALARAHPAVYRFVSWLADHGEAALAPEPGRPEVVEEVPAIPAGHYELNALFAADERPVPVAELEVAIRRIGWAQVDLLALMERVTAFEAAGGVLPLESRDAAEVAPGAEAGRTADAVLRHVAGAETWLSSRLDRAVGTVRYAGPARDGERAPFVEAAHTWAMTRLRELHSAEPLGAATDGKGERWTLAKVLRRHLYHQLDHLEELDRRLCVAEGRVDRVELRTDAGVPIDALIALLRAAGLGGPARMIPERLQRALDGSTSTVSAWDGDHLVGFARIVSDEASNAYVSTVAIDPRWQDRGLGSRIMRRLMAGRDEVKLVLEVRPGAEAFYERLGFEPAHHAMARPRLR